ncbi:threonine synthase [candidate division CSSED10-310 bacterium]|uniref:Threonine synthase n=1 Tax=candidate division CSSED10-310 bacterium TaxID=2855610 RepID=A0ABV6Z3P8_UNCC1
MGLLFYSTNHKTKPVTLEEAVLTGLPADKGLFMPAHIPRVSATFLQEMSCSSFPELALELARLIFQPEIPERELRSIIETAFNFAVPLVQLDETTFILELFHGPTLAFKDFGARFMAGLMSYLVRKSDHMLTILVATSGDTGSAVANGFLDMPGIQVYILYPQGKITDMQEKQITTLGNNITALEIAGDFDDCQRLTKQAFLDNRLRQKLRLTSANSINISRLIPQSFYYFWAYAQQKSSCDDLLFSVPCGNYGNLTAGLLARRMGLPVSRFIAAANSNAIGPHYLETGKYEPKKAIRTISNAMDVGDPSNFARILDLYDHDIDLIRQDLVGYSFTDEQTKSIMKDVYLRLKYILEPHGATGFLGLLEFQKQNPALQNKPAIVLETAHHAKFCAVVKQVLNIAIEVPIQLQNTIDRKKNSVVLANNYVELHEFLDSTT